MDIYLVRHGLTQHNIERRFGGISDVPVTPQGLAVLKKAPFEPKKVYTSPLMRTRQTAAAIFPGAEQVAVYDLHEMNFGHFEGKNGEDMKDDPVFCAWLEDKDNMSTPCPGGENRNEYTERVKKAFEGLVEQALAAGEERLVVVAHGGTQMVVMHTLCTPPMDYHAGETDNGGCRVLRTDAESWAKTHKLNYVETLYFGAPPQPKRSIL